MKTLKLFGFNIQLSRGNPKKTPPKEPDITGLVPGRVSVPDDEIGNTLYSLKDFQSMVNPSFRVEVIKLLRDLYKVNPDVSKTVQDTFQLTNTGHLVQFPNNSDREADQMRDHLKKVSKRWSNYTAGIDGLVNKMIAQLSIGGAISIEAVPNEDLSGLSTILFLKPDNIVFKRESNGAYQPYQRNTNFLNKPGQDYIKLNTNTYKYIGMYNDTDEPYGIPPYMASLDSLKTQADMKINIKNILENAGLMGFLEALIEKPSQNANESVDRYQTRLDRILKETKRRLKTGMKDGVMVGYRDDHEFNLHSTTKEMGNVDKPWTMNQQSVANGLGVNSSLIGVQSSTTEGGAGINLSKLLSQLKNLQMLISYALDFIYSLELRLAGYNNKGITIEWFPATVSDDVKIQQAKQYKQQNLHAMYTDGVISLFQYAQEMGYDQPDEEEPRVPLEQQSGNSPSATDEDKRQADKSKSDRRQRDKNNPSPKRKDQDYRPR